MKKIFLLLFLMLLYLPLIQQIFHIVKKPGNIQDRFIAQFPKINKDTIRNFPNMYESYFDAVIGSTHFLRELNSYIKIKLLSKKYVDGVILGKDGWLFLDDGLGSAIEPTHYSKRQLSELKMKKISTISAFESVGISYLEILIPDKNSTYVSLLPADSNHDETTTSLFKRSETTLLSLFRKKGIFPTYYKTDSHWNRYGSYLAYTYIIDALSKKYPLLSAVRIKNDNLKLIPIKGGDLARILGHDIEYVDQEVQFQIETCPVEGKA